MDAQFNAAEVLTISTLESSSGWLSTGCKQVVWLQKCGSQPYPVGRRFFNVGLHPHPGKIILRLGVLWLKVEDLERRFGLSLLLLLWCPLVWRHFGLLNVRALRGFSPRLYISCTMRLRPRFYLRVCYYSVQCSSPAVFILYYLRFSFINV